MTIALGLCAGGCLGEPSPLIQTHVSFPAGTKGPTSRLHFLAATNGSPESDVWGSGVPEAAATARDDGYDVVWTAGIGNEKRVALRVWFDANDNGVEDAGDSVGTMSPSPFVARDSGGCSDRKRNASPPVTLRAWTPAMPATVSP